MAVRSEQRPLQMRSRIAGQRPHRKHQHESRRTAEKASALVTAIVVAVGLRKLWAYSAEHPTLWAQAGDPIVKDDKLIRSNGTWHREQRTNMDFNSKCASSEQLRLGCTREAQREMMHTTTTTPPPMEGVGVPNFGTNTDTLPLHDPPTKQTGKIPKFVEEVDPIDGTTKRLWLGEYEIVDKKLFHGPGTKFKPNSYHRDNPYLQHQLDQFAQNAINHRKRLAQLDPTAPPYKLGAPIFGDTTGLSPAIQTNEMREKQNPPYAAFAGSMGMVKMRDVEAQIGDGGKLAYWGIEGNSTAMTVAAGTGDELGHLERDFMHQRDIAGSSGGDSFTSRGQVRGDALQGHQPMQHIKGTGVTTGEVEQVSSSLDLSKDPDLVTGRDNWELQTSAATDKQALLDIFAFLGGWSNSMRDDGTIDPNAAAGGGAGGAFGTEDELRLNPNGVPGGVEGRGGVSGVFDRSYSLADWRETPEDEMKALMGPQYEDLSGWRDVTNWNVRRKKVVNPNTGIAIGFKYYSDSDPCWDHWTGVDCDEFGRVIGLNLMDQRLVGTWHPDLGKTLASENGDGLTTAGIIANYNEMTGELETQTVTYSPVTLFATLTALRYLNLSSSKKGG